MGNYKQLKGYLEQTYPELRGRITGENYPTPPTAAMLSNAVTMLQMSIMAAAFMGDSVWNYIPLSSGPPGWYFALKENSMVVLIGAFLVVPTMIQGMVTSGAFEIIMDGQVVFSKLELSRFPNGKDLVQIMTAAGLRQLE